MPRGTIAGFGASWHSGLTVLMVRTGGGLETVFCDNAQTVRAFAQAWPDDGVIVDGCMVNGKALLGKRISYSTDRVGVLEAFTPLG